MADISIDSFVHGGPLTGSMTADVTGDVTGTLTGLDAMSLTTAGENTLHGDATLTVDPLSSTLTLEPVTTTSTVRTASSLDVEPVAVDSCVRVELAPLPPTTVTSPYEQRWSWTLFGVEIFALGLQGTATTHVRPDRPVPVVLD